MNTQHFFEAMNDIDDRYIEECIHDRQEKNFSGKERQTGRILRSARFKQMTAAACLGVVLLTALAYRILIWEPSQRAAISSYPSGATICMNDIVFNEIDSFVSDALLYYDPDLYDTVDWGTEEIINYYGTDLVPAYIPDGLTAAPGNGTASVITDQNQTLIKDSVTIGFYHAYYEDGSPMLTGDVAACRGFSLTASKLGLVRDYVYILPEEKLQVSDIGGTKVTFGFRSMPYGPYDAQTHEPAGYYDLYTAAFQFEGVEYEIITEQLTKEDMIKIVGSIIYQNQDIQIESES